ncbi:MAG: hypothetical protein LBK82_00605 [Planctomycetaceae bacterium]|nr:hypothetical protein [Planctomycetaceae bacterium]
MTPKQKATQFVVVNLIHSQRVHRRDLLANSKRSPTSVMFGHLIRENQKNFLFF